MDILDLLVLRINIKKLNFCIVLFYYILNKKEIILYFIVYKGCFL